MLSNEQLQRMINAELASGYPTPDAIRQLIAKMRPLCPTLSDGDAEELAKVFEKQHGYTMEIGASLAEEDDFVPWLSERRSKIDPYYWKRYRDLLAEKGFSGNVLSNLDKVTDEIVGFSGNPENKNVWDRRGMVVGHVQSGKTANYSGVVCKAADAGYKVIVVIAGVHNNLRNQTQVRIDEGFIGFDTSKLFTASSAEDKLVGVGKHDATRRPVSLTTSIKDFSKATATGPGMRIENLNEPAVFVIKKNSSTLKNMLEWLQAHNAQRGNDFIDYPMLLIDDEADNASINIKHGKEEVSRINGQIRQLLKLFRRSCYIGYTATPFANIFIDPDSATDMENEDLFPKDFIVSLEPPTNYFGANVVFDGENSTVVRHIEDNEDLLPLKHPISHTVVGLPESLREAVLTFVLARAVRLHRGQLGKHNSMLVNASRFTNVQRQLRNEIHNELDILRASIRINGKMAEAFDQHLELQHVKSVFKNQYGHLEDTSWSDIIPHLLEAIGPIEVVEINSSSSGSLDYSSHENAGLNVIAVGGFSLSRGLTLEGLSVSYFLRNSMMYDTLMQMGRWFGYRPGYDDLCRVWMKEEAVGWYEHIADSTEELREELRRMSKIGATPREFGLKVRSHPDTLIVTARNKMGSGEKRAVSIGLGNHFIETAILRRKQTELETNRQSVTSFVRQLNKLGRGPLNGEVIRGGRLVRGVPASTVLDFLGSFLNHEGSSLTDPRPVRSYIEQRADGELLEWDVYFPGLDGTPTKTSLVTELLDFPLICQRRKPGSRSNSGTLHITEKQRVSSRGVEKVGLDSTAVSKLEENWLGKNQTSDGKKRSVPDREYRKIRKLPMLIVHLLAIGEHGDDLSQNEPVVAWSISFPSTNKPEEKVEYVVNTTWYQGEYGGDEDDDDMGGDHDN